MLAKDQIRSVAEEIARTAEQHIRGGSEEFDVQQLWEVVRRACNVIRAVCDLDEPDMDATDRSRRTRYVISELEECLEAARKARVVQSWSASRRPRDDELEG